MNNFILMAKIVQAPQLRYTSENQTPIAEMLVQFPVLRDEDAPATLKVVGWGNLAQEIQAQYHQGDHVIIEGRLGMNTIDRPEGFKEKRAELTVQKICRLQTPTATPAPAATPAETAPTANQSSRPANRAPKATKAPDGKRPKTHTAGVAEVAELADYDDIPF